MNALDYGWLAAVCIALFVGALVGQYSQPFPAPAKPPPEDAARAAGKQAGEALVKLAAAFAATGSIDDHEPEGSPKPTILQPTISGKRYIERNWQAGIYDDAIAFDITWGTQKLPKPTRAVKGILVFADIFGAAQCRVRITINDSLKPGTVHRQTGMSLDYNQFNEQHRWMRTTDTKDMSFRFEPTEVLYSDGTTERF
ncbi:putative membrane transporter protein [Hyphomicrobium sp. 1Nfss2.1]|uniref:hypothetical protein n=1 Tax=Hyphomicrobium sp. 1Nfss2.1 TaxID=3413936 RepID=UPI003C7DD31E